MARKKKEVKESIKVETPKRRRGWIVLIIAISFGFLFIGCVSFLTSVDTKSGNVASIPIKGIILMDGTRTQFGESIASATEIIAFIDEANENEAVEAIILDINSPGGSAVASMELAEAVRESEKPVIAVIREIGTSGAYWVASAADVIVARDLSVTGSIGVIASYIEYAGLMKRFNLTYRRLVAGERKDLGSPYRELLPDEELVLQKKLDYMHEVFIAHVAFNRNLSVEEVRELADGFIFLGAEAIDNGLIDVIGGYDDAIELLEESLNITADISEYKHVPTFIEALSGLFSENSYFVGRGIGDSFKTKAIESFEVFI